MFVCTFSNHKNNLEIVINKNNHFLDCLVKYRKEIPTYCKVIENLLKIICFALFQIKNIITVINMFSDGDIDNKQII